MTRTELQVLADGAREGRTLAVGLPSKSVDLVFNGVAVHALYWAHEALAALECPMEEWELRSITLGHQVIGTYLNPDQVLSDIEWQERFCRVMDNYCFECQQVTRRCMGLGHACAGDHCMECLGYHFKTWVWAGHIDGCFTEDESGLPIPPYVLADLCACKGVCHPRGS